MEMFIHYSSSAFQSLRLVNSHDGNGVRFRVGIGEVSLRVVVTSSIFQKGTEAIQFRFRLQCEVDDLIVTNHLTEFTEIIQDDLCFRSSIAPSFAEI